MRGERPELSCHEPFLPELCGEGLVHGSIRVRQIEVTASGPAIGGDGEAGHPAGFEAVSHGVEDAEVEDAGVDGVVEGIAGDLVGGLEDARDPHVLTGEGEGRKHSPPQLGRQGHRSQSPRPYQHVAVLRL